MEEERYQKELFEFKPPRRPFPGLGKLHLKGDFALTLNLEKIILTAIGLLMLLVVVYALGVERGKAARNAPADATSRPRVTAPRPVVPAAAVSSSQTQPAAMPAAAVTDAPRDASGPYTVLAVTLRKKDAAGAEAARLKSEGYDAFVRQSDIYSQVCIGSYLTRDSAEKASVKVKRLYRDAYVIMK